MCKRKIASDSVVTANETGGWHRGRTKLCTASEDEDHIAFNTDDGMEENKKIKHNQEEVKAHPQKPRRLSPWRMQGNQVMNNPIETQQKWKQIASR